MAIGFARGARSAVPEGPRPSPQRPAEVVRRELFAAMQSSRARQIVPRFRGGTFFGQFPLPGQALRIPPTGRPNDPTERLHATLIARSRAYQDRTV